MDAPIAACCPRCGYDLSGQIPGWLTQCPLEGRCSECGLSFEWGDVLSPQRRVPRWFVEHPWSRPFALVRTALRASYPPTFWRSIRLGFPIRALRLWWLVIIVGGGHVMLSITNAVLAYRDSSAVARWRHVDPVWEACLAAIWPYCSPFDNIYVEGVRAPIGPLDWGFAALVVLSPLGYLALGTSLSRVRVRKVHLLRGLVYSTPVLVALGLAAALIVVVLAILDSVTTSGFWRSDVVEAGVRGIHGILLAGAAVWHVTYWHCFARHYLRLPHAGGVVIATLTIAALLSVLFLTCLFLLTPRNYWAWL